MTSINHSKGVSGQLLAADELLRRGYEVYWAMTFHSSCDLVVKKDNKYLGVEVKARYSFDPHLPDCLDSNKYDLLAIVNLKSRSVQIRENPTFSRPCGQYMAPPYTPKEPPKPTKKLITNKTSEPMNTKIKNYWGEEIWLLPGESMAEEATS